MQFRATVPLFLPLFITSTLAAPILVPRLNEASSPSLQPRGDKISNGVLTAGEIVEAVAQGLAGTKAGGIVQSVADGLKAGGSSAGGKD
ncbi:hypothetical protein VTL71DRAFT_13213 [Oculimacula yallundae]|uniref:Uncharacterized protein n=1 Tax=Oculimacula yallundae TaxID=86028 RepID=A0ABR4CKZ9_9HELO